MKVLAVNADVATVLGSISINLCTYDLFYTALYGSIHCLDKWEGVCAMKIETFLDPVAWHRAERRGV
jgi:hypothetical protein